MRCSVFLIFKTTSRIPSVNKSQCSHVMVFFLDIGTQFFDDVGVGCSLFLVALTFFAVFGEASAFNSDVSKWNTGAVTDMFNSKCN